MSNNPSQLIEELMFNARASGNQVLERRLADTAVWYYQNRLRIPPDNLAARYELADKCLWIMLEMCALMTERIHELESRKSGAHLWTPKGVAVNGDMRKFG